MAQAYSHLHERNVYVEFLQNLAGSYPGPAASIPGSMATDSRTLASTTHFDRKEEGALDETETVGRDGRGTQGRASAGGGGRLAIDMATHRARVMDVLRRLPAGDARYDVCSSG